MKNIWRLLITPSGKYSVLALLFIGTVIGAALLLGGHQFLEKTDTLEFCTSCHTMKQPLEEYKHSSHYKNAYGVQAECADCHMPQDMAGIVKRKMEASNDLYQHFITKSIDTPEKYEEKRLEMAQRVWKRMEDNNSSGCRKCHSYEAMDHSKQSVKAARQMVDAAAKNQTCISCHKGIVHQLPDMSGGFRKSFKKLQREAANPPKSDVLYTLDQVTLFKTDAARKEGGKVLPATELKVLDRKGDLLQVTVEGWKEAKGRGRVLSQEAGKRIYAATLKGSFARKIKVLETTTVSGKEWQKVAATGWVKNENLLKDVKPIWDYTSELFQATCTQCHGAPDVNHFTSTQWIAQLKGMMDFADLDKREERTLLKYLQNHAADMSGSEKH